MATVMEETQMEKLMSQPRTTFMTSAMEYMLMPLIRTVMKPKDDGGEGAGGFAEAELQVAGDGVGLGDVVEGHHHDAEEEHGGDGADPIPVRGEDAVLIGGGRPAHEFERAEVGGEEAEPGDPRGHFAAGEEEVLAGAGLALEVEADGEDHHEVDGDDGDIDPAEGDEFIGCAGHGRLKIVSMSGLTCHLRGVFG